MIHSGVMIFVPVSFLYRIFLIQIHKNEKKNKNEIVMWKYTDTEECVHMNDGTVVAQCLRRRFTHRKIVSSKLPLLGP